MFFLTFLRKLYKTLSRDSSPEAIAIAFAFGWMAGCVPISCGLTVLFAFALLLFRVQISTALFAWALSRLAGVAGMALLYESVGEWVLEPEAVRPFWTWVFNEVPLAAWTGLDHHAIAGGVTLGLVVGLASIWPVRALVKAYRVWAHDRLSDNRFFRWLVNFWVVKALKFVLVGRSL